MFWNFLNEFVILLAAIFTIYASAKLTRSIFEVTFKELVSLESARIWPLYLVFYFSFLSSASFKQVFVFF